MVDCTGLENRQTERFPGFESLSFRQKRYSSRPRWLATLTTSDIPRIGDRPVDEVDVAAILEVLRPLWNEKAETARRVRPGQSAVDDPAERLKSDPFRPRYFQPVAYRH